MQQKNAANQKKNAVITCKMLQPKEIEKWKQAHIAKITANTKS